MSEITKQNENRQEQYNSANLLGQAVSEALFWGAYAGSVASACAKLAPENTNAVTETGKMFVERGALLISVLKSLTGQKALEEGAKLAGGK